MTAQIIEKHGRKEFAVIPYKDFVAMQRHLEDYEDLKALRKAKADSRNKKGEPFIDVARRLGLAK
jgi:PHD/YefM family antitoxin component YafN of YafNO toxin-antitoxin module